jgi:hypothetical protein
MPAGKEDAMEQAVRRTDAHAAAGESAESGYWRNYPPLELPKILRVPLEEILDHG